MAVLFSLLLFASVATLCLYVAIGARKITRLKDHLIGSQDLSAIRSVPRPLQQPQPHAHETPKVSIIVTALNEADTIEPALRSLLAIDYRHLEVIVINDRSTDATPVILDRIAAEHPSLRAVHIDTLPAGWLGKNHALAQGARMASGDYLLFTDADVLFAPDAVARAADYCRVQQVDHLTLLFDVIARTQLLRMMLLSFAVAFMARFQPWKVNRSQRHFVGIGGFNMVRRAAYEKVGGHDAIPLAVLDDLALGKLIKDGGYCQHALLGDDMVAVEWYRDTPELGRGIQKNIFAAFDYQLGKLLAATGLILVARVWPWIALFVTTGATWWLSLATVTAGLLLYADLLRVRGWSLRCLVFAPVVPLIECWMWWKGSLLTLKRGGIVWRGTFYPLRDIERAHRMSLQKKR